MSSRRPNAILLDLLQACHDCWHGAYVEGDDFAVALARELATAIDEYHIPNIVHTRDQLENIEAEALPKIAFIVEERRG